MNMKKIVLLLTLCSLALVASAGNGTKSIRKQHLNALITEYKHHDGFEVVRLGTLETALLKPIIRLAAKDADNDDARKVLKLIRKIRRVAVVDYSDCDEKVREKFSRRASGLLGGVDLLMEVKDGEDILKMYGVTEEEGSTLRDFVLFAPGDCALICLSGSLPMDMIAELAR